MCIILILLINLFTTKDLCHLSLRATAVSDRGLRELLSRKAMSLGHIDLSCCESITDIGIQMLLHRAPNLSGISNDQLPLLPSSMSFSLRVSVFSFISRARCLLRQTNFYSSGSPGAGKSLVVG